MHRSSVTGPAQPLPSLAKSPIPRHTTSSVAESPPAMGPRDLAEPACRPDEDISDKSGARGVATTARAGMWESASTSSARVAAAFAATNTTATTPSSIPLHLHLRFFGIFRISRSRSRSFGNPNFRESKNLSDFRDSFSKTRTVFYPNFPSRKFGKSRTPGLTSRSLRQPRRPPCCWSCGEGEPEVVAGMCPVVRRTSWTV